MLKTERKGKKPSQQSSQGRIRAESHNVFPSPPPSGTAPQHSTDPKCILKGWPPSAAYSQVAGPPKGQQNKIVLNMNSTYYVPNMKTGGLGVLWSMGSRRVGHDLTTKQQQPNMFILLYIDSAAGWNVNHFTAVKRTQVSHNSQVFKICLFCRAYGNLPHFLQDRWAYVCLSSEPSNFYSLWLHKHGGIHATDFLNPQHGWDAKGGSTIWAEQESSAASSVWAVNPQEDMEHMIAVHYV